MKSAVYANCAADTQAMDNHVQVLNGIRITQHLGNYTMEYFDILNKNLQEFAKIESQFPGSIPDSITFDFQKHKGHVVFGSIVHGNEVGSLPGLLKIIRKIILGQIAYGGKVTFFLGNKKAALQKTRFIDYDLNRSFGYFSKETNSGERIRALEIMKILQTADVFLDYHQTNRPCAWPFYIFSMHKESYFWSQAAGIATAFVTRKQGTSFSQAGMTSDEFMRSLNKAGITLELGEQGFHPQAEYATYTATLRTLKNMDKVFNNIRSIELLCKKNKQFDFYETIYQEPFNNPKKILNHGFHNFAFIKAGQIVGKNEDGSPLVCKQEGYILFPKYLNYNEKGEPISPIPGELFVLVDKLKIHPLNWVKN